MDILHNFVLDLYMIFLLKKLFLSLIKVWIQVVFVPNNVYT
jgi:hypothetical protein